MAHCNIFREELANTYPNYGNALWEPDPGGQYNAVEVGDVGFIRRGYFHRLFNVLHPKDHPSHPPTPFVPEDHQQLKTIPNHIIKNEIRTGSKQNSLQFCSQYVTLESRGYGTSSAGPDDDSIVTFTCSSKQGALLSLPVPAHSEDTASFGDFGKWMIQHIDAWFAFARGLGLGINRMEDIILVTGRHLTKSWVNIAFNQRRRDARVTFDVQVSSHGKVSLEQHYVHGGDLKLGPTGGDLPENQCIFVRGFRVVRILKVWPRLRAQAGPADDHGPEPEPGSDTQLGLISVPADSNVKRSRLPLSNPSLILFEVSGSSSRSVTIYRRTCARLRYGSCSRRLLGMSRRRFSECSTNHKLTELLPESAPTLQQFQVSCVLSGNKSGPGADVAVVKVGTLSKDAFEAPRTGSDLDAKPSPIQMTNPQTTDPQTIDSQTIDSQTTNPQTTNPQTTNPLPFTRSHLHSSPSDRLPSDILVDGFIAFTFSPQDAQHFFSLLLQTRDFLRNYCISYSHGIWYMMQNPPYFLPQPPGDPTQNSLLRLDYNVTTTQGTVVPQQRWAPADENNVCRHVESVVLQLPIYFVNQNGVLGFWLPDILQGCDQDLHNGNEEAPLGGRSTTHLRLHWPGCDFWRRQIPIRDETHSRNPITRARFMRHVGISVDRFFKKCMREGYEGDPNWRIGVGMHDISQRHVKIVGAVHVSTGTWMPIIQLTGYVFQGHTQRRSRAIYNAGSSQLVTM